MPKKILLVISSPYGSLMAAEGFRLAIAMIAMDVLPQLLFIDDGLEWLLKNQRSEASGIDSQNERLKTLAEFVGLYALTDSIAKRNLKIIDLNESLNLRLLSSDEGTELIMENDLIIAF